MKIVLGIAFAFAANFFCVDACDLVPPEVPCPLKRLIAVSDKRQLECLSTISVHDHQHVTSMTFEIGGMRYSCNEIQPTDVQFDTQVDYPVAPEAVHENQKTISYKQIVGDEELVNCFQSGLGGQGQEDSMFASQEGSFSIADIMEDVNYNCVYVYRKKESVFSRMARLFAESSQETDKEK